MVIEYIRNKYDTSLVPMAVSYCCGTRETYSNTAKGYPYGDASNIFRSLLRQFQYRPGLAPMSYLECERL